MQKEDYIELFQVMSDHSWDLGELLERTGYAEKAHDFKCESFALREVVRILTDFGYAEDLYSIYFKKGGIKNA